MSDLGVTRRRFIALGAAAGLAVPAAGVLGTTPTSRNPSAAKSVGIALGGGGARGLAHIVILEALDELGVKPARIAGTSMGAMIGALYASGLPAREIRALAASVIPGQSKAADGEVSFLKREVFKWIDLVDPNVGSGGLLDAHGLLMFMHNKIKVSTFEELKTPLQVVAGDIWRHEQVVLDSGDLKSAVAASMAFPGIFSAQRVNDQVLVDGGTVNPVPYDLLRPHCDIVIAVDVSGRRTFSSNKEPTFFESIFNSFQTMQQVILDEKIRREPPDIYVKPDLVDIRLLDFAKANDVYTQALTAKDELLRRLQQLLA